MELKILILKKSIKTVRSSQMIYNVKYTSQSWILICTWGFLSGLHCHKVHYLERIRIFLYSFLLLFGNLWVVLFQTYVCMFVFLSLMLQWFSFGKDNIIALIYWSCITYFLTWYCRWLSCNFLHFLTTLIPVLPLLTSHQVIDW